MPLQLPVVLGYDGSPDSRRALRWAAAEATRRHVALRVVVATSDVTRLSEWNREWTHGLAEERLDTATHELKDIGFTDVEPVVDDGLPSEVLIRASAQAALVVVGGKGHGTVAETLMGSVSQHVARHAASPVVVVREQFDPDATRVVVGVDGSANSRRGLFFGAQWASRVGAELCAVHTWRWLTLTDHPADGLHSYTTAHEAARVRLAEAVAGVAEEYPDVPLTQELVEGRAQRALCNRSHRAALVVVGATGTGAFTGLLLGSVGSDVLHHARCPVAVVR